MTWIDDSIIQRIAVSFPYQGFRRTRHFIGKSFLILDPKSESHGYSDTRIAEFDTEFRFYKPGNVIKMKLLFCCMHEMCN